MATELMQRALAKRSQPVGDASATEELYVEQLAVLAACCRAVASMNSSQQVCGAGQLPGEELIVSLLEWWESGQHTLQVPQALSFASQVHKSSTSALCLCHTL